MPPERSLPIALTSLSIRNFRGIKELDLDFKGPDGLPNRLVVLAGPNGSGKTAVLEAALIAVGGYKLAVGPSGESAIFRGAGDYEIQAGLRNSESFFGEDEMLVDTAKVPVRETNPRVPFWYFSSWRAPKLVGPVNVTVGKPGRRPAKNDSNRLLNVKQMLVNAAAAERFDEDEPFWSDIYSRSIKRVNTIWEKFYPNQGARFSVGLARGDRPDAPGFEVFYHRLDSPRLSVDELSAGQLELFLFLAALVLNDDSEGIVFIDEPELHLDPQWHGPILRALMSLQPRAQFLIATHSPAIYAAAASYERHFLIPDDDPRAEIWGMARAQG